MCDISYRQTKAGWNWRKQGAAKDREEGRDGITQRRRRRKRKWKQPLLIFFSLKVSGTEKTCCQTPKEGIATAERAESTFIF